MRAGITNVSRTLGWQGIVGCLLIGAALFVDFRVNRPLQDRLQSAETTLTTKTRKSLEGISAEAVDLARFHAYFREGGDVTDSLASLYGIAEDKGLKLDSAAYDVRQEKALGLEGYEIVFPVTGPYAKVREFAQTVLDKVSVASLDTMRFNRKRINDAQVDAELRFTFYHLLR